MAGIPVVRVTNVSPFVAPQKVLEMFSVCGDIKRSEFVKNKNWPPEASRVLVAEYENQEAYNIAVHLSNTMLADRRLFVEPLTSWPEKPEEFVPVADDDVLPRPQIIRPPEPMMPMMPPPPIPQGDPNRSEEVRRTIYIGNLTPDIKQDEIIALFNRCGPVKFVRITGGDDGTNKAKHAFLEFVTESSVPAALAMTGQLLKGNAIKVNHAKNAIVKPPIAQKPKDQEVSRALKRVEDVEAKLMAMLAGKDKKDDDDASEPSDKQDKAEKTKSPSKDDSSSSTAEARTKSPSSSRRRERSRSRDRDRDSRRDRDRRDRGSRRDRDKDRDRRRRSPSPRTGRSPPRRSRSRSPVDRSSRKSDRARSRSRSPSRKHKKKHKKEKSRRRSRERSRSP